MSPINVRLIDLRQRSLEASGDFIEAQRAYTEAADLEHRKSEEELKLAAEAGIAAAAPYEAALSELLKYLGTMEQSEARDKEIKRTELLLAALAKEREVFAELVEHHTKRMLDEYGINS